MVSAKKLSLSVTNVIKNLNINLPSPDILSLFTNKRNFNVIFANTRQHSSNTLKNINSQFMKELSFLARFAHFKQNQLVTFTHIFSHNTRKRNFNVQRHHSIQHNQTIIFVCCCGCTFRTRTSMKYLTLFSTISDEHS